MEAKKFAAEESQSQTSSEAVFLPASIRTSARNVRASMHLIFSVPSLLICQLNWEEVVNIVDKVHVEETFSPKYLPHSKRRWTQTNSVQSTVSPRRVKKFLSYRRQFRTAVRSVER